MQGQLPMRWRLDLDGAGVEIAETGTTPYEED